MRQAYFYSAEVGDGASFNWHVCRVEYRYWFWRWTSWQWQVRYFEPNSVFPTHTFQGEVSSKETAYSRVRYLVKDRK